MTVWMKFQRGAERCREREEERRKRERKETEKRDEEQRRKRRRKNVIWKGIEGEDEEAIGVIISRITRDATGEKKEIRRLEVREGEGGRKVIIAEMESKEDRDEMLEMREVIWKKWRVMIDEDLTMEERRARWRMVKRAKKERRKGKKVEVSNRRMWIDGEEWRWVEEEKRWQTVEEE